MVPAGHKLSPKRLKSLAKAIEAFRPKAIKEEYDTEIGASNNCNTASDSFLHELEKFGIKGAIKHYDFQLSVCTSSERKVREDLRDYPFEIHTFCIWHWAVRVQNVIIDWTARQFDVDADFPAIWIMPTRRIGLRSSASPGSIRVDRRSQGARQAPRP